MGGNHYIEALASAFTYKSSSLFHEVRLSSPIFLRILFVSQSFYLKILNIRLCIAADNRRVG